MGNNLRQNKIYKKIVYAMAMVYVFFVVLKRKPKYIVGFLTIALAPVAFIALVFGMIKLFGLSEVAYEDDTENNEVAAVEMQHDASDALWFSSLNVDMEKMHEENPDVLGWIYFEAEDVLFPVVVVDDRGMMPSVNYNGALHVADPVIIEAENNKDFSDRHTFIYAHNLQDGTMFDVLNRYKSSDKYYGNHQYFQVIIYDEYTGDTLKSRYRVFTCNDVEGNADIYFLSKINYANSEEYAVAARNEGNYISDSDDIAVGSDDKLVTLSACAFDKERVILTAVKVAECVVK